MDNKEALNSRDEALSMTDLYSFKWALDPFLLHRKYII